MPAARQVGYCHPLRAAHAGPVWRPERSSKTKRGIPRWLIIWKDVCSKSVTAACFAHAGSVKIRIMALAIPCRPGKSARADRAELVGLLIAGYLLAWMSIGVAAHFLDLALHVIVRKAAWLPSHGWLLGAVILLIAFQFTRLKYHCLERCRTPLGFIVKHWHGVRPRHEVFRLGLDHGVFRVGCCWAIMLLMFVVGTGNIGWMLILGAVMALEKNAPWGRKLSQPLGAALIAWAALIVVGNLAW